MNIEFYVTADTRAEAAAQFLQAAQELMDENMMRKTTSNYYMEVWAGNLDPETFAYENRKMLGKAVSLELSKRGDVRYCFGDDHIISGEPLDADYRMWEFVIEVPEEISPSMNDWRNNPNRMFLDIRNSCFYGDWVVDRLVSVTIPGDPGVKHMTVKVKRV